MKIPMAKLKHEGKEFRISYPILTLRLSLSKIQADPSDRSIICLNLTDLSIAKQ